MKYNEPIIRCLSANSVLKANLESGQRSEEFWLHEPKGDIGQDRTLLPAPAWSLVLICRPSKVSREEQKRKSGVRRETQKSVAV